MSYEEAAYEEGAYDMDDSYSMESAAVSNAAMGNRMEVSEDTGLSNTGEELPQEAATDRKLIRTVNLSVETESFDALLDSIQEKVTELGGYVERMDENNGSVYYHTNNYRNASITARVPADQLDAFLDVMAENSNITYRLYDYGRLQDGKPRQLHIKQSLDVIRCPQERENTVQEAVEKDGNVSQRLVSCPLFTVDHFEMAEKMTMEQPYSFLIVDVLEGEGSVNNHPIKKGDHFIAPFGCGNLEFSGKLELITSHVS